MTTKLQEALSQLDKLPSKLQDEMAEMILDELNWQRTFDQSQSKLSNLAQEALAEYKSGKTKPQDL